MHDEITRIIARDRDLVRVLGRLVVDLDFLLLLRLLDVVVEPFADVRDELLDALARRRRDGEELQALLLGQLLEARQILLRLRQVDLVGHEDLRAARDLLAVLLELCVDLVEVIDRVAALDARGIDDVQDELRALDVAQEVVAEADAIGCALDEAWDVRHDEALLVVRLDDTEHRRDRREVVLRDLRARRADAGDEARLADRRIADEADIREQLELKDQVARLARLAKLRKRRGAVGRICEFRIAAAAAAALADDGLLANLREVREDLARLLVLDDRAGRHLDVARRRILAVLVLDVAVLTVLRLELAVIAEVEQGIHVLVHDEDDVAAAATVTARRASLRDELLAAERRLAVTAIACLDDDACPVDKLHDSLLFLLRFLVYFNSCLLHSCLCRIISRHCDTNTGFLSITTQLNAVSL